MKNRCAALVMLVLAGLASAQERIPSEQAEKIAKLITECAAKESDLVFKAEVDTASPFGMKDGERAGMIVPAKNLTADTLAKPGKDVAPVAHLWFRKVTLVVGGNAVANDKLRTVTVTTDDGKEIPVTLLLVGVRKGKDGAELVLFGKGKEIVATLPLKEAKTKQDSPIEFEVKKGENMRGTLIFSFVGKYQAELPVQATE